MKFLKYLMLLNLFFANSAFSIECSRLKFESTQYKKTFSLKDYPVHDARIFGELLDVRLMKRHILNLSGKLSLDCGNCVEGRSTLDQKKAVQNHLMSQLSSLKGVKVELFTGNDYVEVKSFWRSSKKKKQSSSKIELSSETGKQDLKALSTWLNVHREIKQEELKSYLSSRDKEDLNYLMEELKYFEYELEQRYKDMPGNFKNEVDKEPLASRALQAYMLKRFSDYKAETRAEDEIGSTSSKETQEKPKLKLVEVNNIVATIEGSLRPNEVIELVAHYDTANENRPGADANASGVALALELARMLSIHRPSRSVRIVLTDLGAKGSLGAKLHLEKFLAKKKEVLVGSLLVDSIGYAPSIEHPSDKIKFVLELGSEEMQKLPESYQLQRQLAEVFLYQYYKYIDRTASGVKTETFKVDPDSTELGSYFKEGKPAISISQPYDSKNANPSLETTRDHIELFNMGFYEEVSRVLAETIALTSRVDLDRSVVQVSREELQYLDEILSKSSKDYTQKRVEESKKGITDYIFSFLGFK